MKWNQKGKISRAYSFIWPSSENFFSNKLSDVCFQRVLEVEAVMGGTWMCSIRT